MRSRESRFARRCCRERSRLALIWIEDGDDASGFGIGGGSDIGAIDPRMSATQSCYSARSDGNARIIGLSLHCVVGSLSFWRHRSMEAFAAVTRLLLGASLMNSVYSPIASSGLFIRSSELAAA